jgi:hypothetical protein
VALNSNFNQANKLEMIYIDEEDKENIHPNIMARNKKVQFSDKFKRYPISSQLPSESSLQVSASKQGRSPKADRSKMSKPTQNETQDPQVSYFEIDELKNISKQISLKDVSRITTNRSKILTK